MRIIMKISGEALKNENNISSNNLNNLLKEIKQIKRKWNNSQSKRFKWKYSNI